MFISIIEQVPTEPEVFQDDEKFFVLTPIAISEDERRRVAVLTALYPFVDDGAQMHELQFAISVEDIETDEVFTTCERDMAKGYVPEEARPLVMDCVCVAVRALVQHVKPEAIYRVTKAVRPPRKALHKHQMITDTLHSCGYETTDCGTDIAAREFWLLER